MRVERMNKRWFGKREVRANEDAGGAGKKGGKGKKKGKK